MRASLRRVARAVGGECCGGGVCGGRVGGRRLVSSGTADIDCKGLEKMLEDGDDFVWVDVRSPGEITETGKVSDKAVNVPLAVVPAAFGDSPDAPSGLEFDWEREVGRGKPSGDETIVISCASGNRSQKAAKYVKSLGYSKVVNMTGGASAWLPEERE